MPATFLNLQPYDGATPPYRDSVYGGIHNGSTLFLAPDPADVFTTTEEGKHALPISFLGKPMTPPPSLPISTSLSTVGTDVALRAIASRAHTVRDSGQNYSFLPFPPSPPSIPSTHQHRRHTKDNETNHRDTDDELEQGSTMEQQPKPFPIAPHLRAKAKCVAPADQPAPFPIAPHQRAKAKAAQSIEQDSTPAAATNATAPAEQPQTFPIAPHHRLKKTTPPPIDTAKPDSYQTNSAKASSSLRDSAVDVPKSATIYSPTSVREKLSAFGVTVGEAAPANLEDLRGDWPTIGSGNRRQNKAASSRAPTSAWGGKQAGSAPRNDPGPKCYNCGIAGHLAWSCPNKSGDNVKAGQSGSQARAPQEPRWPKNIPAGDPKRWESDWNVDAWDTPAAADDPNKKCIGDHDSHGWTVDSYNANAGWEERKAAKRAPAGAPGYELAGFNGEWAPAPLDWDSRPGFFDDEKVARLDSWIDETEKEIPTDRSDARGVMRAHLQDGGERDFAPPYWTPLKFGGQKHWVSPKVFFQEVIANNHPEPVHPDDLRDVKPWWDLLDRSREPCLRAINDPLILGIDPDESVEERIARENDHGSNHHATNRMNAERAKVEAKKNKKVRAQQRREALIAAGPTQSYDPRRIKAEVSGLYIRSAKPADMLRAKEIYNHYVKFTCCAPENGEIHDDKMIRRLQGAQAQGFPFLVAGEKGAKIPPRRGKNRYGDGEALYLPDKIVGFAYAEDYHHSLGQFRYTCELKVFVHGDYLMKGVGSCLMDKLLMLLDPKYIERGGYELVGEDMDGIGAKRDVKDLIVNLPYDRPERLEWCGRWMRGLGFEQVGTLGGIGVREERRVSVAIFQRSTGLEVDPANPPQTSTYIAW